jgi:putative heme-binding domain-containing protein
MLLGLLEADVKPRPERPTRPHIEHWTIDVLGAALVDAQSKDAAWGEKLFFEARCVECHRFRGRGGSTGPDLTGVGGRLSEADLLVAMVDPNKDVSDQYAATWIETDDGLFTGRLIDLDDSRVVLDVDPYEPVKAMSIPRSAILSMEPSDVSTMPAGLLNGFTPGEIRALVDWLRQP